MLLRECTPVHGSAVTFSVLALELSAPFCLLIHFVFRQALISTQHIAQCVFAMADTLSPGRAQEVSEGDPLIVL